MDAHLAEKIRIKRNFPPPQVRRRIRECAGLTQADVAKSLRVDRATVTRYELGERTPSGDLLARYVALLDELTAEMAKTR